jgi:hypothetical protein
MFKFTAATLNGKKILTHNLGVTTRYLINKGIALPAGF